MSGAEYLSAAQRAVSLIITGGVIVTMDDERRVLTPGAIAIAEDGIVAVGSPDSVQTVSYTHLTLPTILLV